MIQSGVQLEDYMLPCLNKTLLGFECMGCGLQRSIAFIIKGEFIEAFFIYPAIYTIILLFITVFISIFKKYKYINKIIVILALTNVSIIIISYLIKLYIK